MAREQRARVIGVVGGVDRAKPLLEAIALRRGHLLEVHAGRMNGTGDRDLSAIVLRSDLVVVTTDVNSHAGVRRARELARHHHRPCVLVRRLGPSRLEQLLDQLGSDGDPEEDCSRASALRADAGELLLASGW